MHTYTHTYRLNVCVFSAHTARTAAHVSAVWRSPPMRARSVEVVYSGAAEHALAVGMAYYNGTATAAKHHLYKYTRRYVCIYI